MNAHVRQRLNRHSLWLAEHEPEMYLVMDEQAEQAKIIGRIRVSVGGGRVQSFALEIRYRQKNGRLNPFLAPNTYDPDGQFEPHEDRHIGEGGWFCIWLPQCAPDDFDKPDGLARHLDRMREFLLLQLMFDRRRRRNLQPFWPGEQWDHGTAGQRQWVREQVEGLNGDQMARLLWEVGAKRRRHPASTCPCHSGFSYRRCHRGWVLAVRSALKYEGVMEELSVVLQEQDALAS